MPFWLRYPFYLPPVRESQLATERRAEPGIDDLGGVLLRIYNRDRHDRKSILNHRPGGSAGFFAAERTV
jgi:hypothetical protein